MNQKIKIILMISIFLSLIAIPKIAFHSNNLFDTFSYSNTSLAQTAINEGQMEISPYENVANSFNRHANGWSVRWAVTSSVASISLVTGLSPRELQSLPICAIGILVMAYLVASKLTKDWRFAAVYTAIIAFDPTVNSLTNGTYIQGWGFIFYFMLIYVTMIIAERKHYLALKKMKEHYRPFILYSLLASCAIFMMYLTYYSTLVYGVILLATVTGGVIFAGSDRKIERRQVLLFIALMAAAFVALYFAEASVRFALSNFQDLLSTTFDYGVNAVSTAGPRFYVGLISYILILLPLFVLGLKWFRALVRKRQVPKMDWKDIIITSFLVTGAVNMVMYAGLGLVDLKYVIMFFSLSALYAIKRLRPEDLKMNLSIRPLPARQLFAIAMALLFVLKFATYIGPAMEQISVSESEKLDWISENCLHPGTDSISDLRLSGEIMLLHTEHGNREFNSVIFSAHYLTTLDTGNLTQFYAVNGDIGYIIMNRENMDGHFNIGNWETWDSDENPEDNVARRDNVQRIYSSSEHSVWRVYF